MPQGNFKSAKVPKNIQNKQKKKSGAAFTRRSNAPIQPKKGKFTEQQKIKQVISRTVNKSAEDELRGVATERKLNLSKAQEAVAKHHQVTKTTNNTIPTPAIFETNK